MLFLVRGHWARPLNCVLFLNFIRRRQLVRYSRLVDRERRILRHRLTWHWFRPVLTLKIDLNQLSAGKRTSGYPSLIPRNDTEIVSLIFKLRTRALITPPYTAVSRKVVGRNAHATIPKGNMGYDQCTVRNDWSCRTYFCCFPLVLTNICLWPPVPFFQISLKNSALKATHNTFPDCRVHFFR